MTTPAGHREGVEERGALVAAAAALKPVLRERQRATEEGRRVSDNSIADIRSAGLYRVVQPARYGGLETDFETLVGCASEIGAGCGSTAWVYSTAAIHQWQIGMFHDHAQRDVWGDDPSAIAASSYSPGGTATVCEGGYHLRGRWLYCSGVLNAQWMILGVLIAAGDGDEPHTQGYVLVPRSDYQVVDNWDVMGLVGTGSSDVLIDEAFVPAHRMLTIDEALSGQPPGAQVNTGGMWKVPFFAAVTICLCAPAIGMAQGALETYIEQIGRRQTRGAALSQPQPMAMFPTIQARVGEAAAAIDGAKSLVLADCAALLATMATNRSLTERERARNKGDLGYAVKLARRAADMLFESVGGAGLSNDGLIQRYWRDLHAASKHISLNWDMCSTLYGRVILGLPAGTAQF